MNTKILLAGLALFGSIQLSAYTYEVSPLIGKNFTQDNALLDDSTAFGIRLNKYISEDNAIMFGYTRINNADYKHSSSSTSSITAIKSIRTGSSSSCGCTVDPCAAPAPCPTPKPTPCPALDCSSDDSSSNGSSSGSDADNGNSSTSNGSDSNAENGSNGAGGSIGGNGSDTGNGNSIENLSNNSARNTDINRFYINGLHNIKTKYTRLVPYVYGGFGYEHVANEFADNDSQGFFNAGAGLKFRMNNKLSLVSDVQGIKKFRNHDLDILGSLGVAFMFGQALQPEPESIAASGLEDISPAPIKRELTVVKVAPTPAPAVLPATAPSGEYYVQMAAGFKTDMETGCKHTKDLRDAGIAYDIKYTQIKGKNAALVVVGPFETKEEAAAHLPELRHYSKDAFIKRIKN